MYQFFYLHTLQRLKKKIKNLMTLSLLHIKWYIFILPDIFLNIIFSIILYSINSN